MRRFVLSLLLAALLTPLASPFAPTAHAQPTGDWAIPGGPGYGWSVDELHAQMFGYHYNLTAGHASSSPWWSWPLALKPTWFFNGSYDLDQVAVIYNGGNPILFWAGVPAVIVCAVLAWRRRSAGGTPGVIAMKSAAVPGGSRITSSATRA